MIAQRSIRRHLLAGGAAAALLVGGVGGWAATTELAGAVIAPGQLVVPRAGFLGRCKEKPAIRI